MAKRSYHQCLERSTGEFYGGNVKNAVKIRVSGALVLLCAGLWIAGCKSAPPLTQSQALSLIQAMYDQTPGTPF